MIWCLGPSIKRVLGNENPCILEFSFLKHPRLRTGAVPKVILGQHLITPASLMMVTGMAVIRFGAIFLGFFVEGLFAAQ